MENLPCRGEQEQGSNLHMDACKAAAYGCPLHFSYCFSFVSDMNFPELCKFSSLKCPPPTHTQATSCSGRRENTRFRQLLPSGVAGRADRAALLHVGDGMERPVRFYSCRQVHFTHAKWGVFLCALELGIMESRGESMPVFLQSALATVGETTVISPCSVCITHKHIPRCGTAV